MRRQLAASARAAVAHLKGHDLILLGAGLAFYAVIAVVPLLVVALFLAGIAAGHDQMRDLMGRLADLAPEHLGFAGRLVDLAEAAASIGPLVIAAALLPATTYGEGVLRVFDRVSGRGTARKGLRGRVRAFALLGVLPLILLVGLGAVAVLPGLVGMGPAAWVFGAYLTFLIAWVGATMLLAVTYRAFSPVRVSTVALVWASAGTGSFLAGMSLGWVAVLGFGVDVGQAYGGASDIGAVVLLAGYLFLVQLVCIAGYAWALGIDEVRARAPG